MDLRRLRDARFTAAAKGFFASHAHRLQFADQDVINVIAAGRIAALHPRWNVTTALYDWVEGQTLTFGLTQVHDAVRHPRIAHFTGLHKPWGGKCPHPLASRYLATLAKYEL